MQRDEQTATWLAEILDRQGAALVLYARQWCDCPEDVVQEALLELVSQRQRPDHVMGWLYRVVRNRAISAARGQRRRVQREQRVAASESWFQPATALDAQEAAEALGGLPLEVREPVVARIWGGLTFAEIGQLVGVSTATAQRRYEQGLRELRSRLERTCPTNDPQTTG